MADPMQEVIPGLWIGDYNASQDHNLLKERNISCIVSGMRQEYAAAPGIDLHRVSVDDTDSTNILEHFVPTADFIDAALRKGQNVLVHCQAGVSRSTTLLAAYLMRNHGLNVEQAVERIRSVRPQVEPSEFFMMQLELFERCQCEWDPVKWPEERRFLMSFAQAQIMGGAPPSIVLAYYPSPSQTPNTPPGTRSVSMSSMSSQQISPPPSPHTSTSPTPLEPSLPPSEIISSSSTLAPAIPTLAPPPARKRLTPRKTDSDFGREKQAEKAEIEKIGSRGEVVVSGRRIRCKMCRRELAAREHIVAHELGKGQQAFAPNRRDMAAYRAEQEQRRQDLSKPSQPVSAAAPSAAAAASPPVNPLAALRISQPIAGNRVVQPRPSSIPRPQPVARPQPRQAQPPSDAPIEASTSKSTSEAASAPAAAASPADSAAPPPDRDISLFPSTTTSSSAAPSAQSSAPSNTTSSDPPLLPSPACSSYFVEPLSWMSPILETGVLAGKITCPSKKCGAKLGNFDWAGTQCSCGAWVCPGFALNVSRVDEVAG
ncbi:Dual specificity protein phosphatase 1 [Rhodotorula toruloides]|nr:Dual specificity protein phosphatase 1 [Rhodotorula toruloides]